VARITRRQFLGLLGAGFLGLSGYEYYSKERIQIERRELRVPKWDADGLKVALITDMHISWARQLQRARRAIQMAIEEKPDVIIFAGDLIEYNDDEPLFQNLRKALEDLQGTTIPCFATLGNHEYALSKPKLQIFKDLLKASPVKLLVDEVLDFQGISLIGIQGPYKGYSYYGFIKPEVLSKSSIAIVHEPDYCHLMKDRASIQLSGHSHGGQICLPLGIPLLRNKGALKYNAGFYPSAPVPLYVSRGVGTTEIDLRLFCPPEVSILTIRGA
jgi:hypothetical protein